MTTDKADSGHGYKRLEGSLGGCLVNLFSTLAISGVTVPGPAG